jgi:Microtubule-binding stalk of dynein motor/ATP-binding dynein motor region
VFDFSNATEQCREVFAAVQYLISLGKFRHSDRGRITVRGVSIIILANVIALQEMGFHVSDMRNCFVLQRKRRGISSMAELCSNELTTLFSESEEIAKAVPSLVAAMVRFFRTTREITEVGSFSAWTRGVLASSSGVMRVVRGIKSLFSSIHTPSDLTALWFSEMKHEYIYPLRLERDRVKMLKVLVQSVSETVSLGSTESWLDCHSPGSGEDDKYFAVLPADSGSTDATHPMTRADVKEMMWRQARISSAFSQEVPDETPRTTRTSARGGEPVATPGTSLTFFDSIVNMSAQLSRVLRNSYSNAVFVCRPNADRDLTLQLAANVMSAGVLKLTASLCHPNKPNMGGLQRSESTDEGLECMRVCEDHWPHAIHSVVNFIRTGIAQVIRDPGSVVIPIDVDSFVESDTSGHAVPLISLVFEVVHVAIRNPLSPRLFTKHEVSHIVADHKGAAFAQARATTFAGAHEYVRQQVAKNLHFVLCVSAQNIDHVLALGTLDRRDPLSLTAVWASPTTEEQTRLALEDLLHLPVQGGGGLVIDMLDDALDTSRSGLEFADKPALSQATLVTRRKELLAALLDTHIRYRHFEDQLDDFVKVFITTLTNSRVELSYQWTDTRGALYKLQHLTDTISGTRQDMDNLEPQLQKSAADQRRVEESVMKTKKMVQELWEVVQHEEANVLAKTTEATAVHEQLIGAKQNLERVTPSLNEAIAGLRSLTRQDLNDLQAYLSAPPETVQKILEALCVVRDVPATLPEANAILNDPHGVLWMLNYDRESLSSASLQRLHKYVINPHFNAEDAADHGKAAKWICAWISSTHHWATANQELQPLQNRSNELDALLKAAKQGLRDRQSALSQAEERLTQFQSVNKANREKNSAQEARKSAAQVRLARTERLQTALESYNSTWSNLAALKERRLQGATGDALIVAAMLTYFTRMDHDQMLIHVYELVGKLRRRGIECTIPPLTSLQAGSKFTPGQAADAKFRAVSDWVTLAVAQVSVLNRQQIHNLRKPTGAAMEADVIDRVAGAAQVIQTSAVYEPRSDEHPSALASVEIPWMLQNLTIEEDLLLRALPSIMLNRRHVLAVDPTGVLERWLGDDTDSHTVCVDARWGLPGHESLLRQLEFCISEGRSLMIHTDDPHKVSRPLLDLIASTALVKSPEVESSVVLPWSGKSVVAQPGFRIFILTSEIPVAGTSTPSIGAEFVSQLNIINLSPSRRVVTKSLLRETLRYEQPDLSAEMTSLQENSLALIHELSSVERALLTMVAARRESDPDGGDTDEEEEDEVDMALHLFDDDVAVNEIVASRDQALVLARKLLDNFEQLRKWSSHTGPYQDCANQSMILYRGVDDLASLSPLYRTGFEEFLEWFRVGLDTTVVDLGGNRKSATEEEAGVLARRIAKHLESLSPPSGIRILTLTRRIVAFIVRKVRTFVSESHATAFMAHVSVGLAMVMHEEAKARNIDVATGVSGVGDTAQVASAPTIAASPRSALSFDMRSRSVQRLDRLLLARSATSLTSMIQGGEQGKTTQQLIADQLNLLSNLGSRSVDDFTSNSVTSHTEYCLGELERSLPGIISAVSKSREAWVPWLPPASGVSQYAELFPLNTPLPIDASQKALWGPSARVLLAAAFAPPHAFTATLHWFIVGVLGRAVTTASLCKAPESAILSLLNSEIPDAEPDTDSIDASSSETETRADKELSLSDYDEYADAPMYPHIEDMGRHLLTVSSSTRPTLFLSEKDSKGDPTPTLSRLAYAEGMRNKFHIIVVPRLSSHVHSHSDHADGDDDGDAIASTGRRAGRSRPRRKQGADTQATQSEVTALSATNALNSMSAQKTALAQLVEGAMRRGEWVLFLHCERNPELVHHIAQRVENARPQSSNSPARHEEFRLWLSVSDVEGSGLSSVLVDTAVKVSVHSSISFKRALLHAYWDSGDQTVNTCKRPLAFKRVVFALNMFHAVTRTGQLRGRGLDHSHEFTSVDHALAIDRARSWINAAGDRNLADDHRQFFPAIRWIVVNTIYGAQVASDRGRRLLDSVLASVCAPHILVSTAQLQLPLPMALLKLNHAVGTLVGFTNPMVQHTATAVTSAYARSGDAMSFLPLLHLGNDGTEFKDFPEGHAPLIQRLLMQLVRRYQYPADASLSSFLSQLPDDDAAASWRWMQTIAVDILSSDLPPPTAPTPRRRGSVVDIYPPASPRVGVVGIRKLPRFLQGALREAADELSSGGQPKFAREDQHTKARLNVCGALSRMTECPTDSCPCCGAKRDPLSAFHQRETDVPVLQPNDALSAISNVLESLVNMPDVTVESRSQFGPDRLLEHLLSSESELLRAQTQHIAENLHAASRALHLSKSVGDDVLSNRIPSVTAVRIVHDLQRNMFPPEWALSASAPQPDSLSTFVASVVKKAGWLSAIGGAMEKNDAAVSSWLRVLPLGVFDSASAFLAWLRLQTATVHDCDPSEVRLNCSIANPLTTSPKPAGDTNPANSDPLPEDSVMSLSIPSVEDLQALGTIAQPKVNLSTSRYIVEPSHPGAFLVPDARLRGAEWSRSSRALVEPAFSRTLRDVHKVKLLLEPSVGPAVDGTEDRFNIGAALFHHPMMGVQSTEDLCERESGVSLAIPTIGDEDRQSVNGLSVAAQAATANILRDHWSRRGACFELG